MISASYPSSSSTSTVRQRRKLIHKQRQRWWKTWLNQILGGRHRRYGGTYSTAMVKRLLYFTISLILCLFCLVAWRPGIHESRRHLSSRNHRSSENADASQDEEQEDWVYYEYDSKEEEEKEGWVYYESDSREQEGEEEEEEEETDGYYEEDEEEEYDQYNEEEEEEEIRPLPHNPIYKIPDSSVIVGDRSDAYARLRREYDTVRLPLNLTRSQQFVQNLAPGQIPLSPLATEKLPYDIYNCPPHPPPNYPYQFNLLKILDHWPVEETAVPSNGIYQGLCVLNFQKDLEKAFNYRAKQVPFVVENDPQVARTVERWNQQSYVEQMVGPRIAHRTEVNRHNSHFMFHRPDLPELADKESTNYLRDSRGRRARLQRNDTIAQLMRMTFAEWLKHANQTTNNSNKNRDIHNRRKEYYYYRLIGCGLTGNQGDCDSGSTEALFDEMPFFQPKPSLYVLEPEEQAGIHCRFGMRGVIAENHFDGPVNSIAMLSGQRRYILAHPNQCDKLALLPMGHPSMRHSAVDYANPDLERFPEFADAASNEVVLQPGQVLYLPSHWFHFIVSLDLNYQCNTRSGDNPAYNKVMQKCGF